MVIMLGVQEIVAAAPVLMGKEVRLHLHTNHGGRKSYVVTIKKVTPAGLVTTNGNHNLQTVIGVETLL